MMAELVDMDCMSVAQVYGSDSSAHAMRIAGRLTARKDKLVPHTVGHDFLINIKNYCGGLPETGGGLNIIEVNCDNEKGMLDIEDLKSKVSENTAAVFVQNPTYLGNIEFNVEEIGKPAKEAGAEFIVYVDPISLGVWKHQANMEQQL